MKNVLFALIWVVSSCLTFGQSPFGSKQSISTNTGSYPRVIESGHLNNDNFADIVLGTDLGGTVEWYKNNGNGTFTLQTIISSTLPRVNGIAIADLDNDNDNDVIATSLTLGRVVWFENNGSGSFGSEQVIANGLTSVNTVKAGDIDNNNTVDIVVSTYSTDNVSWYSNNGSGSFGTAQTISGIANSGPLDIDLADYDQDNDLDVVVAYGKVDAIILFNNDHTQTGTASFTMESNLVATSNFGLRDVHFGDVNNDGDLEIIKVDQYQNTAWYDKSGGSFNETVFNTSNSAPASVFVADINDDNSNDVIVGYAGTSAGDKLTWYKDASSSGEQQIDNSQDDIYGFTLNDFDNDGDLDLASISSVENDLNWFKNITDNTCDPNLEGTACNDGDDCTVNDVYDANCDCAGTLADSDNDGVCDADDQCPGFDDTIDTNGNGVPDGCESGGTCEEFTANFANNSLSHTGSGSNSTTLSLPADSQDVTFTISSINQKTKGKASSKFIERVVVSYINGSGSNVNHGTYSGSNVSSVAIDIQGEVQSVTVTLSDEFDGSTTSNMNINFTAVTYCVMSTPCVSDSDNDGVCDKVDQCPGQDDALIGTPCDDGDDCTENDVYDSNCGCSGTYTDSDGDGVCDAFDQCPGFDDTIDTNGNGVPDGCESSGCQSTTGNFPNNPLTHSGSGSNSTTLNLANNSQDVSFSVSGIGQKTKGKQSNKYIELVTVTYMDEFGDTQTHGVYSGTSVSSATIDISGIVQSVTVSLTDAFDGNTSFNMSVNLSEVNYCVDGSQSRGITDDKTSESDSQKSVDGFSQADIKIYPNPASHTLFLKLNNSNLDNVTVYLFNISGQLVRRSVLNVKFNSTQSLDVNNLNTGLYLLRMEDQHGTNLKTERIIIK